MIFKKYYKRNGKTFEITRIYEYNKGMKTMTIEIKEYIENGNKKFNNEK